MMWAGKFLYPKRYLFAAAALVVIVAGVLFFVNRPRLVVDPAPLLLQALKAEENGRLPEAVGVYEEIFEKDPKYLPAYVKAGQLYFRMGLPGKAEETYLKAIEQGLADPDLFLYLGYIKESQEKFVQAVEYYAKAELAGSVSPVLYFNMGNAYARLGDDPKALASLKRAVGLDPQYVDAFVNLAIVSAGAGEYSDAQYYVEKAEKLGYQAPEEFKKSLASRLTDPGTARREVPGSVVVSARREVPGPVAVSVVCPRSSNG